MTQASNTNRKYTLNPFEDKDFNLIFDELYIPLCRYAMKFVHHHETAEDIVQEIFIYIWENRERISKMDSVKMYLFTAVKNKSLNFLKKNYLNNKLPLTDESDGSFQSELQPDVSELLEYRELESLLEQALNTLPEKCRIIFTMKRFADLSNKEVAEHLNISLKTVESQMTIALKKMNNYLNSHWQSTIVLFFSIFRKNYKTSRMI
jgi:RNA polymerase sigma-70 factor, ECF subfamily